MRITALLTAFTLAATPAMIPVAAHAAHAGAPYKNVNKKNDAGNDTGDAKVDQLNQAQLDKLATSQPPAAASAPPASAK